ncbi:zinc-ribbon domain-containing protein [bacterium]|nr:zinc-ribbon domain-containing protein [bacterium]
MFFIFGFGPRTKDLGPDGERDCPHCHNRRTWRRWEQRNWITLFFVPVIPLGAKRMTLCPICGYGHEE